MESFYIDDKGRKILRQLHTPALAPRALPTRERPANQSRDYRKAWDRRVARAESRLSSARSEGRARAAARDLIEMRDARDRETNPELYAERLFMGYYNDRICGCDHGD